MKFQNDVSWLCLFSFTVLGIALLQFRPSLDSCMISSYPFSWFSLSRISVSKFPTLYIFCNFFFLFHFLGDFLNFIFQKKS